jgi:ankyrin repeat protein
MPLPHFADEAALRELEPKCADRESSAARPAVRQLLLATQAYREALTINCTLWGLPNLVRCATEAGVSPDLRFTETQAPVIALAAEEGHSRVVKVLLNAGADCNLADSKGYTALQRAAAEGRLECVQLLLAAGADTQMSDWLGNSPLIEAAVCKHLECARILLPLSDLGHYSRS